MSIMLHGWRKWLVVVLAFFGVVSVSRAQETNEDYRPPAPRRTSVILIVADHLGWGDLGCYGQTKIKTPNLDQMAAEGVRFTSFYAGSAAETPARASLLLGLHPGHLDIRGDMTGADLSADDVTVAQVLQKSGYRTGLVGVWGLGAAGTAAAPQNKGFYEFAGFLDRDSANNDYANSIWRHDPNHYDNNYVQKTFDGPFQLSQNDNGQQGLYLPDLISRMATNFVRIYRSGSANRWRPYFLVVAQTIPNVSEGRLSPKDAAYASEPWPLLEKIKADMIAKLDESVGALLQKLRATGLHSNTVVILTSAAGPQENSFVNPKFLGSTGPFRGAAGSLNEGGIRVPMIVWSPTRFRPAVVNEPWAAWDIFPTVEEIGFLPASTNIDGVSFLTTLYQGSQTNRHEHLYWEVHGDRVQQAVRLGDWKGYRPRPGAPLELYNLKSDPGEKNDVADKHRDVAAKIEKLMRTARTESSRWPLKEEPSK